MSDQTSTQQYEELAGVEHDPKVRALDRLVGTWTVTGGAIGTVTYEWMPGGHFLLQRVELRQDGQPIRGIEVIGHLRIWAGQKGSPARFTGEFGAGDRVMDGEWVYPGGGGYRSTMTRDA